MPTLSLVIESIFSKSELSRGKTLRGTRDDHKSSARRGSLRDIRRCSPSFYRLTQIQIRLRSRFRHDKRQVRLWRASPEPQISIIESVGLRCKTLDAKSNRFGEMMQRLLFNIRKHAAETCDQLLASCRHLDKRDKRGSKVCLLL